MSEYFPTTSIWLTSMTSDTSFMLLLVGRRAQHPQALFAEPLKAVRRAARLERPAAENLRAGLLDRGGRREHLLLGLRRAGPGHHDDLVSANPHIVDHDDRALRA